MRCLRGLSALPRDSPCESPLLAWRGAELGSSAPMPQTSCRSCPTAAQQTASAPTTPALNHAVLAPQSRCRRSWRRCRAAAAWCRAPVRRGRPLRGAAARSALAKCTRRLGSSRGSSSSSSSGRRRSAPATAAQAAAAGAAAPGECVFVLQMGRSACCSLSSTACLALCDAPRRCSPPATTRRHVGFEPTPAEQTAAGGGQAPGAAGHAAPAVPLGL